MSSSFYIRKYKDTGLDLTNLPTNLHLSCEVNNIDGDLLYYVKSGEETKLYKYVFSTNTESLIETRSVNIARLYPDLDNDLIYFVDSNYDRTTSFVWNLDLTDDSINEVDSAPDNIYDVFIIEANVYMIYFSSSFIIETGVIRPESDGGTTDWDNPDDPDHSSAIDEIILDPTVGDAVINTDTGTRITGEWIVDEFVMEDIDIAGGEVTQIKVYVYHATNGSGHSLHTTGDQTGTTTRKQFATIPDGAFRWNSATYSGLSLNQAEINALEIIMTARHQELTKTVYLDTMYVKVTWNGALSADIYIKNITQSTSVSQDMGAITDRSYDMGQVVVDTVNNDAYFLWKWSDENVEIWKYDVGGGTIEQQLQVGSVYDFGADTNLPPISQWALTFDGVNIISFVLGDGEEEESTIVCEDADQVNDGEYINIQGIDENGDTIDYYVWFDKVGDESGDPAPANRTGIVCDISAVAVAQDVSNIVQAAINTTRYFAAGNAVGTSVTVTLQNVWNGSVTDITDVDTGWVVAVTDQGVDNIYYYHIYNIDTDIFTKKGEYNIALMMDRNVHGSLEPFSQEKAYHVSNNKIYQLVVRNKSTLQYISDKFNSESLTIIAITDHYIIDSNGNIYRFDRFDLTGYI